MARAWMVEAMDILRNRNVAPANDAVARYVRPHLFTIELKLTEPFEDLRTVIVLFATAQKAVGTKVASIVRGVCPPDRGFIAAHIELEQDSRLRKTLIEPQHPTVDLRVGTNKDLAALFVLVKAIEDPAADKCAGLRRTNDQRLGHGSGDRI